MKHQIFSTLLIASTLSLTACRKAPEPVAAMPEPVERPASVSIEQAEAPAPARAEGPATATGTEDAALPAAPRDALDLESLNTILENYATAYDRVPKSVDEMVRLKLIPHKPKASPGKKYVIDTVRRQIREEKL